MVRKKRYAQVGLGGRHVFWRDAVLDLFSDSSELVGFCDG